MRSIRTPSLAGCAAMHCRRKRPAGRLTGTAVLDVRNLTVEIDTPRGIIHPVRDVSFLVHAGETVAIVGESGSGKSLTGLALIGLLPPAARVSRGSAWLQGHRSAAAG